MLLISLQYLNQFRVVKCFTETISILGNATGVPQNMEYVFRLPKYHWKSLLMVNNFFANIPDNSLTPLSLFQTYDKTRQTKSRKKLSIYMTLLSSESCRPEWE